MRNMVVVWAMIFVLGGCQEPAFEPIDQAQSFVATLNMEEPSMQYFDESGQELATWALEEYYTGAVLIDTQYMLFYSHALPQAAVYELATGERLYEFTIDAGTTNALYDAATKQILVTNDQTNTVSFYQLDGEKRAQLSLRNYPMSMALHDQYAYIINYKDTWLSIIDIATHEVIDEWPIEAYSNGIVIDTTQQEIWMGGHGQGTQSNTHVYVYDLQTGQLLQKIKTPVMPVNIAASPTQKAVISHGNNALYLIEQYAVKHAIKVGANPFAVGFWHDQLLVAGYDDNTLYYLNEHAITKTVETDDGPFQLIVRD